MRRRNWNSGTSLSYRGLGDFSTGIQICDVDIFMIVFPLIVFFYKNHIFSNLTKISLDGIDLVQLMYPDMYKGRWKFYCEFYVINYAFWQQRSDFDWNLFAFGFDAKVARPFSFMSKHYNWQSGWVTAVKGTFESSTWQTKLWFSRSTASLSVVHLNA